MDDVDTFVVVVDDVYLCLQGYLLVGANVINRKTTYGMVFLISDFDEMHDRYYVFHYEIVLMNEI
jgi:hypothetical protein